MRLQDRKMQSNINHHHFNRAFTQVNLYNLLGESSSPCETDNTELGVAQADLRRNEV